MEKIGYYGNGNQGIKDRDVFKRNGKSMIDILDTLKHHLYVCPIDSKALERHILSRNFLRKNDWARLEYQRMKYELAEKANQDKTFKEFTKTYIRYCNGKRHLSFCCSVKKTDYIFFRELHKAPVRYLRANRSHL